LLERRGEEEDRAMVLVKVEGSTVVRSRSAGGLGWRGRGEENRED